MFSAKTYTARRHELRTKIGSGIILFPGNPLSPNNYPNNAYYFRQDSSFRYYFGLNVPSVVGVIDADTGEEALYGDDFTVEDIIWTGPQPTLREMGAGVGITATFPMAELEKRLRKAVALGRRVHYLPPYRGENQTPAVGAAGHPARAAARLQVGGPDVRRGGDARKEERRRGRGDGTRLRNRL